MIKKITASIVLVLLAVSTPPRRSEDDPAEQAPQWKAGVASAKFTPE
jgi:hypothetical protein